MSYLTHRAERAVIAALLADADPPLHFYGLTSQDFSSRLHREIFTAVMDLATTDPGLDLATRDHLIATRVDLPGATPGDLTQLREQAPDFDATRSYSELVRAGAVYRDVASYADTLARRIATGTHTDGLHHTDAELADPELADPELAEHERRLSRALTRHADIFAPLTSDPTSPDLPDSTPHDQTADTGYPVDAPLEIAPTRSERAALEDQILADLLRDPEQADTLRGFLTDNAFTSSQRRHVYRTIVSMAYDGDPIDEVTVAWRVELETAECALHGLDVNSPGTTPDETVYPVTDTHTEPTAVYLARLAVTTVTIPSAIHAGRDLLAAHLHDVLPDPTAIADAARAQRAQTTRQSTSPRPMAAPRPQPRHDAVIPGYLPPRPPDPLPTTSPQPGAAPTQNPATPQPGVRP